MKKLITKLVSTLFLTGLMLAPVQAVYANTGTVTVTVSPIAGRYEIRNDATGAVVIPETSGNRTFVGLTQGDYILDFKDIGGGFVTPLDQAFTIFSGSNITLNGNYSLPVTTGSVTINVSPAAGRYAIRNAATLQVIIPETSGTQTFNGLAFGDYVVDFKDIGGGFATPQDVVFTLGSNALNVSIFGQYDLPQNVGALTVNVSPVSGRYEIRENATQTVIIPETTGSQTFTGIPFGDYVVDFKDIGGSFITPADQSITLDALNLNVTVTGNYTIPQTTGTININVSPVSGRYEIRENATQTVVIPETTGSQTFTGIPFGDYVVDFKDIGGSFITPADQSITLDALNLNITVNGIYNTVAQSGAIQIDVINQNNLPVTNGLYELRSCTGAGLNTCTDVVANGTASQTFMNLPIGTYGVFATLVSGYSSVAILSINPQDLATGNTLNFTIQYTSNSNQNNIATLNITTQPVAGEIFVNGISIGTPVSAGQTLSYLVDVTQQNTLSFGSFPGYTAPSDIVIAANSLGGGTINSYTGNYTQITTATFDITTQPVAGEIFVNGTSIGTPSSAGTFISTVVDITVSNTLSFGSVAGYITPVGLVIPANTLIGGTLNTFTANYLPIGNTATIEVTTTPVSGEVFLNGTSIGTPVTPGTSYVTATVDTTVNNTISFGAVTGYTTPADIVIAGGTLLPNSTNSYTGTYVPVATTATLEITTQPTTGEIFVNGTSIGTPASAGTFISTTVDVTIANTISFGAVTGYTTPSDIVIAGNTLGVGSTTQYTGTYIAVGTAATIEVTTQPTMGEIFVNGTSIGTPASAGTFISTTVDVTANNTISFGAVAGYTTPADIMITSNTLSVGSTTQYTGTYVLMTTATIEVTTQPVAGEIFVNGTSIGTPVVAGNFIITNVDVTQLNTISFGAVVGYVTPADIVLAANTLTAGTTTQYTGTYISTANLATLEITTQPVAGEIFVNGTSIGTPSAAGVYLSVNIDVTQLNTISFGAVVGYITPADITIAASTLTAGSTTQYIGNFSSVNTATIEVTTMPTTGEIFVNGTSIGTPSAAGVYLSATVDITQPNVITFGNIAGQFTTPIAIPANTLVGGSTTQYTGTYNSEFTLVKTADLTTVGDNQVVTYTIAITRNSTDPTPVNVTVSDTITGTGIINGNAGGNLSMILNSGTCTGVTCTGGISSSQIDQNALTLTFAPGATGTITYQARSSNAGIAVGGNSIATNTVTANYTSAMPATITATQSVTITGPSSGGGGGGGGGGSITSSGGGGHKMLKGEMKLEISKQVSKDGITFVNANTAANGFVIPERETTRIYTKVTVKNVGALSASNIQFEPTFDTGKSDMTSEGIENVTGAKFSKGVITLDKIMAGKSATFTYIRVVTEHGENDQFAIDGLKLVSYKSKLPKEQDGLTYTGIGITTPTYLFAGQVPAWTNELESVATDSDILSITLSASSDEAKAGSLIDYVLTVKNVSGAELTGFFLNHDYPENALEILKAVGAVNDGKELKWQRPILRKGEIATFKFTAKVLNSAPKDTFRATTRAMVSEAEGIPTLENFLKIGDGKTAARSYRLAQTGPMGSLMIVFILSILTYLGLKEMKYRQGKQRALTMA